MRRRSLICLGFIVCSITAMRKRPLSPEHPAPEEMQEADLASKAQKVVAPQAQKELSEQTKAQIEWLKGLAERGEFSDEVAAEILKNLVKVKVKGATEEQKLYNAIANIRAFMEAFPKFYGDVKINEYLIKELARRYMNNSVRQVAIALATTGAGHWLADHVGNNPRAKANLGYDLVQMAAFDQLGTVRFILTYIPQIVNEKGRDGLTALIAAAVHNNAAIVERLLHVPDINVNAQDQDGATALIEAANNGHAAVVKKLLQAAAINVNAQNHKGVTALMLAAQNGHTVVVDQLLQVAGINVNAQSQQGATALILAAQNGHTPIVDRLLQVAGINVNAQSQNGATALILAAAKGNKVIVERLLQAPGLNDVNVRSFQGFTALGYARRSNSPNKDEIIKLLIDHSATE